MKIRWKLLILLLLTAMVPITLLAYIGRTSTRNLGKELAGGTRAQLAAQAESELSQTIRDAARLLKRQREVVELAVQCQAERIEAALAGHLTPDAARTPYFDTDFDDRPDTIPGLADSPEHNRLDPHTSRLVPLRVSYQTPVIRLAPGLDRQTVADDIAALQTLAPLYRGLDRLYGDLFFWQYTSLESGVHASYPGKGDYPDDYEPRDRQWYKMTTDPDHLATRGEVRWSGPIVDMATGRITLTAAMPIHGPDGKFAGVTAIDVVLSDLIEGYNLPTRWADTADVMIVAVPWDTDEPDPSPVILVQQKYEWPRSSWRQPVRLQSLESSDQAGIQQMLEDMKSGVSAVRRIEHAGQQTICAYGPLDAGRSYLAIIVPVADVIAPAVNAEQAIIARTQQMLTSTGFIALIVLALVAIVAWIASRHVTRPIRALATTAERIAAGDMDARADIRTHDELATLGQRFNEMIPKLAERIALRDAMQLAQQVQQALLPPGPPDTPTLDIAGRSVYCDETGGDYYDYLEHTTFGDSAVGIVVGDVTGHGIASALLMTTGRALIRCRIDQPGDLATILTDVNAHLFDEDLDGKFMTLMCLMLDPASRHARWVGAGHDPAIVYDPDADAFTDWEGNDPPLAVVDDFQFTECSADHWPDDAIITIGTDGIWEQRNPAGQMFGKDRLREVIRTHADQPAEQIVDAIFKAHTAYRDTAEQTDDVTVVVVKTGAGDG